MAVLRADQFDYRQFRTTLVCEDARSYWELENHLSFPNIFKDLFIDMHVSVCAVYAPVHGHRGQKRASGVLLYHSPCIPFLTYFLKNFWLGMMTHAFNLSFQEAEATDL